MVAKRPGFNSPCNGACFFVCRQPSSLPTGFLSCPSSTQTPSPLLPPPSPFSGNFYRLSFSLYFLNSSISLPFSLQIRPSIPGTGETIGSAQTLVLEQEIAHPPRHATRKPKVRKPPRKPDPKARKAQKRRSKKVGTKAPHWYEYGHILPRPAVKPAQLKSQGYRECNPERSPAMSMSVM